MPATVHQELRVLRLMLNVAVRKKLLPANPCAGVEFPVKVKGLFRPHYKTRSERRIEFQASGRRYPLRRLPCSVSGSISNRGAGRRSVFERQK